MKPQVIILGILVFLCLGQDTPHAKEEAQIVIQMGPTGPITSVAFSPDGQQIVSGSEDRAIRLYDHSTGQLVRMFKGHTNPIKAVAFSPDGKQIVSGSKGEGPLRLWDRATGDLVRSFDGQTGEVNALAFSPDGQQIVSGSWGGDAPLNLWDRATGELVHTFIGHTNGVASVAFSPDGQQILSGSWDTTLRVWDRTTGELVQTIKSSRVVTTVAFSSDGQQLLSGSIATFRLQLWDRSTGQLLRTIKSYSPFMSLAVSPDGQHVISAHREGAPKLWDLATGQLKRTFKGKRGWMLTFSPDGRHLVSGRRDGTLQLWDPSTGEVVRTFERLTGRVFSLAVSPDGLQLLSGSDDMNVRLWDTTTGKLVRIFRGHTDRVGSVAFSPDGQWVISGSWDNTLRLWDPATGQLVHTYNGHTDVVRAVFFSPDSQQMLSGSFDGTLRLWDRATGLVVHTIKAHSDWITAVAMSPDGKHLLSGDINGYLRLWDRSTGQLVHDFEKKNESVHAVTFSPDSQSIVSGDISGLLRLWDRTTGQLVRTFKGHITSASSVSFSPDGKQLISAGADRTLCLWDMATGQSVRVLTGHTDWVQAVAFSPNGEKVVSGSNDGMIKIWNPNTGEVFATLIGFINGEWVTYTPDNYYVASPTGDQYVSFRIGNKVYDFEQYASIYKRPKIVAKILSGEDMQSELAEVQRETGVDPTHESIVDLVPPEIIFQFLKQGNTLLEPTDQTLEFPTVMVVARAVQRQHGVDRIVLQINDETVYEQSINGEKEFEIRTPIELKDSANILKLVAWSTKQVKSYPRTLQLTYKAELTKGWSLPKLADYAFGKSKSWAVVVGINSYSKERNGFKPLPHAVDDAKAMRDLFANKLGFSEDHIITILDNDATKQHIEAVLAEELPRKVGKDDRVIIYFSGHGHTRQTRTGDPFGYIVPVDGKISSIHPTAISMDQVYSFSELIPAKQILFIVDACYSGIRGTLHKKGESPRQTRQQVETFIKSGGRQIMTAGTANETVVMGSKWDGHSVYTYHLINGLKGKADYNKDGVTTIRELQVYLDDKVPNDAKQTPQLNYLGSGEGQFVFYQAGVF